MMDDAVVAAVLMAVLIELEDGSLSFHSSVDGCAVEHPVISFDQGRLRIPAVGIGSREGVQHVEARAGLVELEDGAIGICGAIECGAIQHAVACFQQSGLRTSTVGAVETMQ